MNKSLVLGLGLLAALAFTSCKSSESAYRKAYEKAKAQEQATVVEAPANEEVTVVTPVVEKPVTETTVVDNNDNVRVTNESVELVSGSGLKNFSVVVGSFSVQANAMGLAGQLQGRGYNAQVVKNTVRNMYRVVATTFDDKASAVQSRSSLRNEYPDAWLLFNQK